MSIELLVHGVPNVRDEFIQRIVVQIRVSIFASLVDGFSNLVESRFVLIAAVCLTQNDRDKNDDDDGHDGTFLLALVSLKAM